MNKWTKLSIEYANRRSYLDDLFKVYPTIPDGIRSIDEEDWSRVEQAFHQKDNLKLIDELFRFSLFPVKDSYIAYLKKDKSAIQRNPKTVNRICGRLYEMGLDMIYQKCSEPKETNRQIGPMFRKWLAKKSLGVDLLGVNDFLSASNDAVLDASDKQMMSLAKDKFNYHRNKGLDFVGRFNGKYVIAEAKFLTDMGGHQNTQFEDAIATVEEKNVNAVQVAILDGVLYIPGNSKMYKYISNEYMEYNIMSALVLREFLYQL